ncbi:GNAT family N-acetyltransferase [Ramlibacter rhizophilus]|uniref:N-acetyltransferase n=1 Tax=Ramlibacter rhizophilus TaxID=1781167 RepID=A0A4Z0BDW8_9BURK|nr:GNAT family N-acetyltransferase [Ramlibacter rhizophilus]TFY97506.1 N-acetyltransferase [Ramlibacter rhizophilus]
MPEFQIIGARDVEPASLHAAFTAAFADYLIGPFETSLDQWPQFLARQCIDLDLSRVALQQGRPLAFCLSAPRTDLGRWRLGTMGALPAARGSGAAPALLDDWLARARDAGMDAVELECFAQNTRALRLYQGRGFEVIDELHGYAGRLTTAAATAPDAVALPQAYAWLDAQAAQLPLQVSPPSLRALPVRLQAWRGPQAQLVFSEGPGPRITVHSLVDVGREQGGARDLVASLQARYADHELHVPPLQRPGLGGAALLQLGLKRLPLHQLWMRRTL